MPYRSEFEVYFEPNGVRFAFMIKYFIKKDLNCYINIIKIMVASDDQYSFMG